MSTARRADAPVAWGLLLLLACLPLGALASAGCATLGDLEHVQTRVHNLEVARSKLHETLDADAKRLSNLNAKLKAAEDALRKSGVDLGLHVDQIEQAMPQVKGDLEAVKFQLKGLRQDVTLLKREFYDRFGITAVFLPPSLPKDADGVWKRGQRALQSSHTRTAQAIFDHFEVAFPNDKRADDALMIVARLDEQAGNVDGAIKAYQRIVEHHPKSDQVTHALWRIGELFEGRGNCKKARDIFEYLARHYRKTDLGKKAKVRARVEFKRCRKRR